MITNIVLENFKCFRKVEVNPRLITVFVGPNGTGKSSVLQALALLKQSLRSNQLHVRGELIDAGGVDSLRPRFLNGRHRLQLGFEGIRHNLPSEGSDGWGARARYSYHSEFDHGHLAAHWGGVSLERGGRVHSIETSRDGKTFVEELVMGEGKMSFRKGETIGQALESSGYEGGIRETAEFVREVLATPSWVLRNLKLVSAARGLVKSRYKLGDENVDDVPGGGGLGQLEEQTATGLGYSRPLESTVSGWMRRVTGIGIRGDPVPPQSVEFQALIPGGDVNFVSEGFGSNALILLFLQLARTLGDSTALIEEPEIHLHPKAQAELASLLTEVAKAESKQLIMTTHSEHIVGRLLTLVAEKKLSADELAIYAFEKDEAGVCNAKELDVTDDGRVTGGIKDFFETNLDELDRFVRALQSNG